MSNCIYSSTKLISLGSCAFRQWRATHSHCSKIHGYELQAKFYFGGSFLDGRNWIIDFGELKEIKEKLNNIFDHTFCVALDDPFLEDFKALHEKGVIDLRLFENGVGIERAAEVCFNVATEYLKEHYGELRWVDKVEVFEHDRNSAIYYNPKYVDNSIFTSSPEDAAKIVQEYLDREAKKAKTQLKHSAAKIREEVIKEFGEDSEMLKEIPTSEQIDLIINNEITAAAKETVEQQKKIDEELAKKLAAGEPIPEAPPAPTQPIPVPPSSTAAPVGQKPTSGNYSDLFKGTRWG